MSIKLRQDVPYVMATKCGAHRVNTCYVDVLRDHTLFKSFEKTFNEVYNYLCNSNVRYKIFKFLENENNIDLELIKTMEIRWISIKSAIYNFDKLYNTAASVHKRIETSLPCFHAFWLDINKAKKECKKLQN